MRQMLLKALASGLIMSLFPFAAISAPAGPSHADSLLRLLAKTHDAVSRERIYVQLADLSGDSLNLAAPYWEAALAEAQKTGDIYGCKEALDFLVRKFAGRDARRAEKYIALADSILPGPRHALFRSSLYAYYIWKLMNDNNAVETVKHELDRLKTKIHNELSPEERIEWEFLTGLSIDFSALATEAYDNIDKAIPHVEQALEKLEKYPLEERLHMERICRDELSELYMLSKDKRAEKQIRQCIDLHRAWLAMDDRFERPHRDTTGYMMRAYSKMLYLRELISKEKANEYYGKCMELARARGDLAEIYSTSARYYQYMGEYERAVAYIDSAVTVYKRNGTKADFASIYAVQSWLYENLGDYKNALEALRTSNSIRHDDRVEEAQNSLAEMQTLFEVGQLELEKSRLANRMKFIALLAGGVLVLERLPVRHGSAAEADKAATDRCQRRDNPPKPPRHGERKDENGLHQLHVPRNPHAAQCHQRIFGPAARRQPRHRSPARIPRADMEQHDRADHPAGKHARTVESGQLRSAPAADRHRHRSALRRTAGIPEAAVEQPAGGVYLQGGG